MDSLVLELQSDALNPSFSAANLLRKALAVATKLSVEEIKGWLLCEMNGYQGDDRIPEYRRLSCQIKVINPYMGLQPLFFRNITDETAKALNIRKCYKSVSELEALLNNDSANGTFMMHFSQEVEATLMKGMDCDMQPVMLVQGSSLKNVLETVKTRVLQWSLELEKQGVMGSGLTFSKNEKQRAASITYNTNNFYGSVNESQIQQATKHSAQEIAS